MNPRDIKRRANAIRKVMTGEHYYDKKYKDLRVADVLLLLEDDNYHTEETILETLVSMDYGLILEACAIELEQDKAGHLSEELYERRKAVNDKIKRGDILTI